MPYQWFEAYKSACSHEVNVNRFWHKSFEYIFDECSSTETEARLVAVAGVSVPSQIKRTKDDSRLKGWLGKTEKIFGLDWDKGHFIAHSIGGAVDGVEANVFPQKRAINRGQEGMFRKMEDHCKMHPGTFCFNRPIYNDPSARPAFYEFGVLKNAEELRVELFDNQ